MSCVYQITFEAFLEAHKDGALDVAQILLIELDEMVQQSFMEKLKEYKELRIG